MDNIIGSTPARVAFAIGVWLLTLLLFVTILGSYFGGAGFIIGFALWLAVVASTLRIFLVSVPEITGLVTINYFGGALKEYETGLNFKFPWEQVKDGNYIDLRIKTVTVSEDYTSSDGPLIKIKWSYQFRPKKEQLSTYIGVGVSTIEKGLTDVGSSFLSADIGKRLAITVKREQAKIESKLQKAFENTEVKMDDGSKLKLEDLYGIELIRVSLADVDYEERYQKARASEQVAARLQNIAKKIKAGEALKGSTIVEAMPDISDKDAMNIALIINGNVQKNVQEVEGKGGEALAALLMAMARGGTT